MPNAADLWKKFQQYDGLRPRAVRRFTDRQDFRKAYYDLVNRAFAERFEGQYIIDYHGVGGAGKSALLRRLEEELLRDAALPDDEARASCEAAREHCRESRRTKPAVLRADFDDAGLDSVESALFRFRAQLMNQNDKAVFPLFDMAMLRLTQKYGRRLPPDEQKEMITDNPVVSFALDVVGDLTGAGLVIGAAQTVFKVGQDVLRAVTNRKSAIRRVNEEIARMDAPELERRLPYYFAMDVNAMGLPLVCVYLDTYEKMTARAEGAGGSAKFGEDWLRGELGLIRNLGNAVFAVAGREKLTWAEPPFEARYIEALSEADSVSFLASCGVRDQGLCARLYELTGGEPVYLDLCVDEYEKLLDDGRTDIRLEDFGENRDRLVERHTRYIPSGLRDGLCLLAAMGRWTDGLCEELCRALPLPSTVGSDYYLLTHLSYVRQEGEEWVMHRPVAQVLARELRPALLDRLVSALAGVAREAAGALPEDPRQSVGLRALEALDRLPLTGPAAPSAIGAMEVWAAAVCGERRYPEALRRQARAVELWRELGRDFDTRYAGSLAAQADILWEQLWNRPTGAAPRSGREEKPELGPDEELERARWARRGFTELRDFCAGSIDACETIGDAAAEALTRLWRRKAQAEDELAEDAPDFKAAAGSWLRAMELGRAQGQPELSWRDAQFRAGRDLRQPPLRDLTGSRALLEEAVPALHRLDLTSNRPFSPRTALAAATLWETYQALEIEDPGPWAEREEQVWAWLLSLDYALAPEATAEELWDWFDLLTTPIFAMSPELAPRVPDLSRVVTGLEKALGPLHPRVLMAKAVRVRLYIDQSSSRGLAGAPETPEGQDYLAVLTGDGPRGRTPKPFYPTLRDSEEVLGAARELTELFELALGRENPGAYGAKATLAYVLHEAGLPERSIPLWRELLVHYDRVYGRPDSRDGLWALRYLVEDLCRCSRWDDAVGLQAHRLELLRAAACESLEYEHDRTRLLYLSRLWQDGELTRPRAGECVEALLALTGELPPRDRQADLESALQWCRERPEDVPGGAEARIVLALADAWLAQNKRGEAAELLEPYAEASSGPLFFRAGVLLRLGKASRGLRAVELLEELRALLDEHPELSEPDRGTALLELARARRGAERDIRDKEALRRGQEAMLEELRQALALREARLSPEDPAVDEARYALAAEILRVNLAKSRRPLRREAIPLLEQVLTFRRAPGGDAQALSEAELSMVEALALEEGRLPEARALYRKAKERMERQHLSSHSFWAPYLLYYAAGGRLPPQDWLSAGEPEHD